MLEWKSEGLGGGLAERQKEEQRPGRDRQRARGEGRIIPLLGAGDLTGGGRGWELERRLGSTCQGPSVTFMSKEQARPQQVPFVGC